jgi:hypothetical protein
MAQEQKTPPHWEWQAGGRICSRGRGDCPEHSRDAGIRRWEKESREDKHTLGRLRNIRERCAHLCLSCMGASYLYDLEIKANLIPGGCRSWIHIDTGNIDMIYEKC